MAKTHKAALREKELLALLKRLIKKQGNNLGLKLIAREFNTTPQRVSIILRVWSDKKLIKVWRNYKLPYHSCQMVKVL